MYIPDHFAARDEARIQALLDCHPFGLLLSSVDGRTCGSHVPFLRDTGNRLLCHLARANPQSRVIDGAEVLTVFTGPHAYVSPSWYRGEGVPTWNYAVAHVYGRAKVFTATSRLRDFLDRMTAVHEAGSAAPWAPRYEASMLDHIVGIEIEPAEIQAKFKLGQNRSGADQARVIERLRARGTDDAAGVAALMMGNDGRAERAP